MVTVEVGGERLHLLAERAVLWERMGMLLLADTHWGKAAAFRAGGIPVPGGTTRSGLERLDRVIARTAPRQVVFLGDFLHARTGRAPGTLRLLDRWRARHPALDLVLVRGNHDRGAGDPPPSLGIRCLDPPLRSGPFHLTHHPHNPADGWCIAGHLHPVVRLVGRARERHRLPCFWLSGRTLVLPAFGEFTGGGDVVPEPGDRVFVVAGDAVMEVPR